MQERARTLAIAIYLPLVMALLVAGLYSNALRNPFLDDDRTIIIANPDVVESGRWLDLWQHHERFGQTDGLRQYRPIAIASYRLNDQLTGLNPAGFRIVNMALLALLGCVVGWWLTHYVGATAAWLAAFVFIAHPVQAEAVNLITGRAQLLALLGVCVFGWLHRRALVRQQGSIPSAMLALISVIVAMGSDTTGLLVIPLAIVQAYIGPHPGKLDLPWLKRNQSTPNGPPPSLRPVHAGTALLLLLPLSLYLWGRSHAIGWHLSLSQVSDDLTRNPLLDASTSERLAASFSLAGYYLSQLAYPRPCTNTIPAALPGWHQPVVWVGLLLLVWLVGMLFVGLRQRHWLSVAGTLAVGQFILVAHIIAAAPIYAAQRLAMPLMLAVAMLLAEGIRRFTLHDARRRAAVAIPCALLVVVMGLSSWWYNSQCRSPESMRLMDLERQPGNPVAMYRFGAALMELGRYNEAQPWLEKAADSRPESIQVRMRLAGLFLLLGRPQQAQEQYQRILDHHPQQLDAHLQLAELAISRNDLVTAQTQITAMQPDHDDDARLWRTFARLALAQGQPDQAMQYYQRALSLSPADAALQREYEELKPHDTK